MNVVRQAAWCLVFACLLAAVMQIVCRKAIQPPTDVEDVIKQLSGLNGDDRVGPPCSLDIQKDLPKPDLPQPLYIVPNTERFWLPNPDGQLQVPRGASIELRCDKSFANISGASSAQLVPKQTRILKPICLQDKTFLWHEQKYEFRQFTCTQPPKYRVERLAAQCVHGEAQLYRVGFNVSQGRFLQTLQVCHDDATLRTHYVQHTLLPASVHFQKFVKRLNFSKAGHFREHSMNFLYTKHNQQQQAAALLPGKQAQYFDEQTLFLARGHLAAKSDFIYANQQRATFNFFNAAPQWQSFNGGQWQVLEDEVRKFVAKQRLEVDCYTGTWGTLTLAAEAGKQQAYYLTQDANNNALLHVPRLYYRVIVDHRRPQRGIALVGVNNPHASQQEILESYVICKDIREQVPWLRWMRNKSLKKGYMYACAVQDFARAVGHLPPQLSEARELLVGA